MISITEKNKLRFSYQTSVWLFLTKPERFPLSPDASASPRHTSVCAEGIGRSFSGQQVVTQTYVRECGRTTSVNRKGDIPVGTRSEAAPSLPPVCSPGFTLTLYFCFSGCSGHEERSQVRGEEDGPSEGGPPQWPVHIQAAGAQRAKGWAWTSLQWWQGTAPNVLLNGIFTFYTLGSDSRRVCYKSWSEFHKVTEALLLLMVVKVNLSLSSSDC